MEELPLERNVALLPTRVKPSISLDEVPVRKVDADNLN